LGPFLGRARLGWSADAADGPADTSTNQEVALKKLAVISLAVLLAAALMPQRAEAEVGFKGGLALSKLSITDETGYMSRKARAFGAYFSLGLGPVAVQPEVLYAPFGARMEEGADWMEYRMDYLQVPVLLKLTVMPGPISPVVYAGPYGAYLLSAKGVAEIGGERTEEDFKDELKSTDYGLVFGGGVDFKMAVVKISVEIRYNLGLANLDKEPEPGFSVKNRSVMILAGIGF